MRLGAFFILILLAACSTANKDVKKAKLHFELGTAQLESGNYPEALQELLTADSMDPENPYILNQLGLAYFVRDKFLEAQQQILRSLKIKPDYTDARNNLARVLISMGKNDDAISELEKVLKDLTYTTPEKAHTNLGIAYMNKESFEKSKKSFSTAIQINRTFCPAYNYYGQTLFRNKEYEKAIQIFDSAAKQCDQLPSEIQYYGALSYYKIGQLDKAIARFEEVIKEYPETEIAHKSENMLKIIKNQ
jgi:tetratricopeptide (TPR) repeat protein